MQEERDSAANTSSWLQPKLSLLLLCFVFAGSVELFGSGYSRSGFTSAEVDFTDPSMKGLQIMPASCAISPGYYHTILASNAGSGGGAAGAPFGGDGGAGGGGGGGSNQSSGGYGGSGSPELIWTQTSNSAKAGPAGGGGGGGGAGSFAGGHGGFILATGYGGGGGGAGNTETGSQQTGGTGAPGIIVIKYNSKTVYLTSGTSWVVPADWTSLANSIEVIGGGAGGVTPGNVGGAGGGGGGYSKKNNLQLTPSVPVAYAVGLGGTAGVSGGDTYFCNTNTNCGSISGSAVAAGAQGGQAGSLTTGVGGVGGAATSGIGDVKYSGGTGGTGSNSTAGAGGGGGGAAGPQGNGGNGGTSTGATVNGAGGGGANGGENAPDSSLAATSRGGNAQTLGEGKGFVSSPGQSEFGSTTKGITICVTNSSANKYFIPANTASELQSFKSKGSGIPNVHIY